MACIASLSMTRCWRKPDAPREATNAAATPATTEVLEMLAATSIAKMNDRKLFAADKHTSHDGANAFRIIQQRGAQGCAIGAQNTNDASQCAFPTPLLSLTQTHTHICKLIPRFRFRSLFLRHTLCSGRRVCVCAQESFRWLDHVLHRFRGIFSESASGVAQQLRMHYFDEGDARARREGKVNGKAEWLDVEYFHMLPMAEQNSAVLAAMAMRAAVGVKVRRPRRAAQIC
eukprot:6197774-Pleurochrysis_carterae.AAC.1